ncbi:amino acid adenylation domain-containing protein [Amycolatopsis sp. lyj-112]|uniref:amino acid adenylation domain-containing protein n=1 Tax=Amycolatopsis sp. lyj-112 TaxID=2789288 RepID=UPI00397D0677
MSFPKAEPDLVGWFEQAAAVTPDAAALVCGDAGLSFGELDAEANRWAGFLRESGVGPEVVVGVCAAAGIEVFVVALGVLKAGGVYLPLDPAQPDERLAYMLGDGGASIVVAEASALSRLGFSGKTVCLDEADVSGWDGTRVDRTVLLESLTYLVYTSGSTGRPKGIALTERTLRNVVGFQLARGGGRRNGLQVSSLGFDVSLLEMFVTWLSGGTLVVATEAERQDPDVLLRLIAEQTVERLYLGPALLGQLANAWARRPVGTALREILVSGDVVRLSGEVRDFLDALPNVVLENQYGPSETHEVSAFLLDGDSTEWPELPSIGAPITGVTVYVLDEFLNPVPAGVRGEIYVDSPGLARGYVGQAGLTAERFVANPFSDGAGARMYRTGDRGKWRPGGGLEFGGRVDDQVKVRGFRVEPAEVEAALTACPGVGSAAVKVVEGAGGVKVLAGYVVAPQVSVREIREFVRSKLPDYLVPASLTVLDALPLNRNGKVDKKALPVPELSRPELSGEFVAPRTVREELLAEIWCTVLGVDGVGVEDDFFELGGHSLLVTQVVSRIRAVFGVAPPVRALFEHRTIAGLVKLIDGATRAELPPIEPRAGGDLALSFAQRRLWFIDQLSPGSPRYAVENLWRLDGELDVLAFARALDEVWKRHDALRATFADDGGRPRQVIAPPGPFGLPVRDLSSLAAEEAEQAAIRFAEEDAGRGFDLTRGPLVRAQLFRVGRTRHFLMLNFHHVVVDGWSMRVIWSELSAVYQAFTEGRPSPLRPLPVQYADYAAWQRSWLDGEQAARQLEFWRAELAGADLAVELAADHPRPAVPSGRGRRLSFEIGPGLTHRLRAIGRAEGATMFMVLLAAFNVVLARNTGSTDIVTGTPVACRNRPEIEDLVGFLANTIPVRVQWAGDPAFTELLRNVRDTALRAYTNEDLPFDRLVEDLAPARDLSRNPLFQTCFVVDSSMEFAQPHGLTVDQVGTGIGNTRFDLEVLADEYPDALRGFLGYSTDLFTEDTASRLLGHFLRVLESVAAEPDRRLSRLPVLGDDEKHTLLVGWNRSRGFELPLERELIGSFEDRAAKTPDARALVCGGSEVSFGELDAAGDRWASLLRESGAGPEVVIGVCTGVGTEVFEIMLGVLKAGAVYLPLDLAQPGERLNLKLADSRAEIVVADEAVTHRLAGFDGTVLCLDDVREDVARRPAARVDRLPLRDSLAYMVYTSGSTGKPKGIALTARTVEHLVAWQLSQDPRPRTCGQLAPIGFDVSLQEFFVTLLSGGTLVVLTEQERQDPETVLRALAENGVERLFLPPAQLGELALAYQGHALRVDELILAGEALRFSHEVKAFVRALGPETVVENQYGSSEEYKVTSMVFSGDCTGWPDSPPIGRPVANVSVFVLDRFLNPVPAGVPGEIYVQSPALARGYAGQPGLTAEWFVANPFSDVPGTRMYRTGDRGRWLPGGVLEFVGRVDDQVKVRGYRVELGEVEAALTACPGVGAAAVSVAEGAGGAVVLAGYVVAATGETVSVRAVREFLRSKLPDYLVPASVTVLESLPLNHNGKVDRKALPAPALSRPELSGEFVAPRNAQEEVLAEVWGEVLGIEGIGVEDDFFELGGHSLLVTQVVSRIRGMFDIGLPIRVLFENRTIAELAEAVEEAVVAEVAALSDEDIRRLTADS